MKSKTEMKMKEYLQQKFESNPAKLKEITDFLIANYTLLKADIDQDNAFLLYSIPAGTIVSDLITLFKGYSDIPIELPVFMTFSMISAELINRDIVLEVEGSNEEIELDSYHIILAGSGEGKTTARQYMQKTLSMQEKMYDVNETTVARFIDDLSENVANRRLVYHDEVAHWFEEIRVESAKKGFKKIMLSLYSHENIEKKTRKTKSKNEKGEKEVEENVSWIENPTCSFLGTAVYESFLEKVTFEDLIDGFAQRFQYINSRAVVDRDPEFELGAKLYANTKLNEVIKEKWNDIQETLSKNTKYIIPANIEEYYKSALIYLRKDTFNALPKSYFKRISFLVKKYCVFYHILNNKQSNKIDQQDVEYAVRTAVFFMKNTAELLAKKDNSETFLTYEKAKKVYERHMKEKGRCIASDIVRGVKEIKKASEAKIYLEMCQEDR